MAPRELVFTPWQQRFREEAARQFPARIERAVAEPTQYARTDRIPKLAALLGGAIAESDHIDTRHLGNLVELALDILLTVGAGSGYRYYEEFLNDAVRLIDILAQRGAPTSRHLLAAARFQAGLANGDPTRRGFIEQAVAAARNGQERLVALLTLAKFHIDVSDYEMARRTLAQCDAAFADEALRMLRPDYETSVGLSCYYTEPETARHHFENAVRMGREHFGDPLVRQPTATALHYLGRIAADHRKYHRAIELFTEGEALSDNYLTGHGYYHQRVAEILVDHGSVQEAEYHLRQAETTFAQVGQQSSGRAILQGTWARFYLRRDDLENAEWNLLAAIQTARRDIAPRVELVLLAELLRLRFRQRKAVSMVRILGRAALLYVKAESRGGPTGMLRQASTVLRMANSYLRPRRSPDTGDGHPVLACPCGADHSAGDSAPG